MVEAIQKYCKCPSKHNFFQISNEARQFFTNISEWCLKNDQGRLGLALVTTLMPPLLEEVVTKDPFKLQGQKLCGEDLELYFEDVFGVSNNYVYGMHQTKEQDGGCVEILAKVFPIGATRLLQIGGPGNNQTFQALETEYLRAKHAWEIGVGPKVLAVRRCTYKETEYAIFVMERWGIGTLSTLISSGYYQKHRTEINRKIKDLLDTLYMSGFDHGDLHSGNILFDENMNLKMIDFEESQEIDADKRRESLNVIKGLIDKYGIR